MYLHCGTFNCVVSERELLRLLRTSEKSEMLPDFVDI